MTINVPQLQNFIGAGLNILVAGPPGTGKTAMLKEAVKNLGWNMKYYSTPTLDPFVHILGIPVPNHEKRQMEFFRDGTIADADVIFFDEANRASDQVLNAILEITQFRTVNGEALPKLKSVVIAVNPAGDELSGGTEEMSSAFVDRFDIYLESEPTADYGYFKAKYGADYARAGIRVFKEYQKSYNQEKRSKQNALGYLSPRRLEKMMDNFKLFPTPETITVSLPSDVTLSSRTIAKEFNIALGNTKAPVTPAPTAAPTSASPYGDAIVEAQIKINTSELRSASNYGSFMAAFDHAMTVYGKNDRRTKKLLDRASIALAYGVGPATIDRKWKKVVREFTPTQSTTMMSQWPISKREQLRTLMSKW